MALTALRRRGGLMLNESVTRELAIQHNLNTSRLLLIPVEDLGSGGDITERAEFQAAAEMEVEAVTIIPKAASSGVDGSNTAVITLRNITGTADIATVTLATNLAANTPVAMTLDESTIAAADVVGIVVTNGAAADLSTFNIQVRYRTASQLADDAGTAYTA